MAAGVTVAPVVKVAGYRMAVGAEVVKAAGHPMVARTTTAEVVKATGRPMAGVAMVVMVAVITVITGTTTGRRKVATLALPQVELDLVKVILW